MAGRLFGMRGFVAGIVVASVIGAGGLAVVRATSGSSSASSFVPMTPVRVVDTRSDLGLVSLVDGVEQSVTIVGSLVPLGATAVSLTVTAVDASAAGFVSVRAGDATGVPSTSNLNVERGGTIANSVVVKLPTVGDHTGTIKVLFDAMGTTNASTDVLIDVLGYYELAIAGAKGDTGAAGAKGADGTAGTNGTNGTDGAAGAKGADGTAGTNGTNGTDGAAGTNGTNGTNGASAPVATGTNCVATKCTYKIGDTGPGGGLIFFVDYNDQYAGFNYLEAAPVSCEVQRTWSLANTAVTAASGWAAQAVGQGQANTNAIRIVFGSDTTLNNAAQYADALANGVPGGCVTSKDDWFLGSLGEMMLMYTNLRQAGVGGFSTGLYWSSSENDDNYAWGQVFDYGSQYDCTKNYTYYVRPVRAF